MDLFELWVWLCICCIGLVVGAPVGYKKEKPLQETKLNYKLGIGASKRTEQLLKGLDSYELVFPSRVDDQGDVLDFDVKDTKQTRRRRSVTFYGEDGYYDDNKWIYYKLRAYGTDFHFNLTVNTYLISKNYIAEYWDGEEIKQKERPVRHCHYYGHISSQEDSRVALSNCYGLHGVFATEDEEYFVEPLWNYTNSHGRAGRLHVVYKRSAIKTHYPNPFCGVKDKRKKLPLWWLTQKQWQYNDILKSKTRYPGDKYMYFGTKHRDRGYVQRHMDNKGYDSFHYKWKTQHRERRSVSVERYVETMVVVDKSMVSYHGSAAIEPYVLTIMNIVANLFHDSSIGNPINIVVTRLGVLLKDQPDLEVNHHADRSLESFCKWQQKQSPFSRDTKTKGVADHDNAILITRYDICKWKNEPCGTLGLAPVAGMCQPNRSCSINEDIGLASAFTIAHEIGHNFGMQHDGIGNDCFGPGHLMAAQMAKHIRPWSWSDCSREYVTSFLDSGRGQCLDNEPPDDDLKYPPDMPGQVHNAHAQCRFQYGTFSKACRFKEVCQELYCINRIGRCVTNSIPAAEGTTCYNQTDHKGWCYKGRCEPHGWKPEPQDGGWGDWSDWGSCTRTCGGGVEASERLCDQPEPGYGGKYCTGERKRYKSCNTHDCPLNATDFREIQCSSTDTRPFRGALYKWVPYAGGRVKPCALNCMAVGYNFYTERSTKVVDGTQCFPDTHDICINGECKPVGCDKVLGSNAVEDRCRVCGGDGTMCETIEGTYMKVTDDLTDTYKTIVTIPQGAVHIHVEEISYSKNYLALKSTISKRYYINGDWTIDWPRIFEVGGTVFHYERQEEQPERLTAIGPTSEDLTVMLLLQEENKGVRYEYTMPIANGTQNASEFGWQYTPWSECSRSCAKGYTQSLPVCVRKNGRTIVQNLHCFNHLKPKGRIKNCNDLPCPPEWALSGWSECSKTCGGGVRSRQVLCIRNLNQLDQETMPWDDCVTPAPNDTEACNVGECPSQWATGDWAPCFPSCGPGFRSRQVYCVSTEGEYLKDHHCDIKKKPHTRRKCQVRKCPPPKWVTGQWGECSSPCGEGKQRRYVACLTHTGKPSGECDKRNRPVNKQACTGSCLGIGGCRDVRAIGYCPLVVKFGYCERDYFHNMCCKTCTAARKKAGLL